MNKTVLIHIGPPKTGTSAIQYALHQNKALLQSNGVYYPEHEFGPNDISSGNMHMILSLNDDGKWRLCPNKVETLLEEFEASSHECLLLSSEYFFYVAIDIANYIPHAQFIAYIRCPLETFESSYNQSVKRHMRTTRIEFGKNLHMTTLNILSTAIDRIGDKRFILRSYLPSYFPEFSLLNDFCAAANLPLFSQSAVTKNKSYSYEALECKRWLNQFPLHELDANVDQVLQAYEDGEQHFSLLPETHQQRYKKQAYQGIRGFSNAHKVVNGRKLTVYLKSRELTAYSAQKLDHVSLTKVAIYISNQHPHLYKQICNALVSNSALKAKHLKEIKVFLKPLTFIELLWLKVHAVKRKIT